MAQSAVIYVSKRFQRACFGFLCIAATQFILASCTPEPVAMAARVITGH